jgi:hypothetical protein
MRADFHDCCNRYVLDPRVLHEVAARAESTLHRELGDCITPVEITASIEETAREMRLKLMVQENDTKMLRCVDAIVPDFTIMSSAVRERPVGIAVHNMVDNLVASYKGQSPPVRTGKTKNRWESYIESLG